MAFHIQSASDVTPSTEAKHHESRFRLIFPSIGAALIIIYIYIYLCIYIYNLQLFSKTCDLNVWIQIHIHIYLYLWFSEDGIPVFLCIYIYDPWWRHQKETFSALLALCEGNPPVTPTKANDAESCFLWSAPEQTVKQTIETPVIWDSIVLIITSL